MSQASPAAAETAQRRRANPLADLALAVTFLTIVPVRGAGAGTMSRAAAWFPLVGAAIGAAAGGVRIATDGGLGGTAATVLAMIAMVVVTGALHQDGLADTADGLGVRGDRERRLAAMRDSAVGVFGALALLGWAFLLVATVAPLSSKHALAAFIAAAALGRWAALVHATWAPPARADGLGAGFEVGQGSLTIATVIALAAAAIACGPGAGAAAVGAALVIAAGSVALVRRTLGGRTGDTLGATVAVAEVAALTALLAVWGG